MAALHPDDPRHGTTNGYGNLRCRCAACCRANTLAMRIYQQKNRTRLNARRRCRKAARRREQDMHEAMAGMGSLLAMPHIPPDRRHAYQQVLDALRQEHECDRCPRG